MTDDEFLEIAAAILDGTPVEWQALAEPVTEDDRQLLRRLHQLADMTDAHRRDADAPARWGHLEIAERIGSGTFGDVYRARDTALDRPVALKLLRGTPAGRHGAEGRLLARVRHPNVVTVHGAAEHDGKYGIWMEFIEGRTLAGVAASGAFTPADVVAIGLDICRALQAVHAGGLLHGDIKPQNVMREDSGRIVLTDFGTGRILDDESLAATIAGTPLYVAPEVLNGDPMDAATDIYSVGVLLYFLLTGAFPVEGRTLAEVRTSHSTGRRTSVGKRRPDIPRRLATVVDRATAASKTRRFRTAADLEAALANVATPARWRRGWAIAAMVALAVTISAGWWRWRAGAAERDAGPLTADMTPNAIVARGSRGVELWRHTLPASERVVPVDGQEHAALVFSGQRGGVLAGSGYRVLLPDNGSANGLLFWFAPDGRLQRTFSFADRPTFGAGGGYAPLWVIANFRGEEASGSRRIAVAAHHYHWWPGIVTVLDERFERLGTFVNPGWIERLHWISPERLIVTGFSDARDGGMIALLNARALNGQAPAFGDAAFRCTSCGPDVPLRYVIMPRSEVNRITTSRFNRALVEPSGDRLVVRTVEVPSSDGSVFDAVYEFTPTLDLLRASYSDRYWDLHRTLEIEGRIRHTRAQCPDRDGPRQIETWEPHTGWTTIRTRLQ